MAKHFVIAVGGTGMRCLESLIHLCAAGMFDDQELHILSLETDPQNGNKERADRLIDDYIALKGGEQATPTRNSFFTAKIKFYSFVTQYAKGMTNYELIRKPNWGNEDDKRQNTALADLLFDDDVLNFDLSHGYRAQTHLGSLLMYHAIVDSARRYALGIDKRPEDDALAAFLREIDGAGADVRIFVLGSIFGGTGASSIPVLPRALDAASRLVNNEQGLRNSVRFGCSLLTHYFGFAGPSDQQKEEDKIVAESANFAHNSQAALSYYDGDVTVEQWYQGRYHIGWPLPPVAQPAPTGGTVVTGGKTQKNPSHLAELLSAAAAWHFLMEPPRDTDRVIMHRSIPVDGGKPDVEAGDLVGPGAAADRLQRRLGMLYAVAMHVMRHHGSVQNLRVNLKKQQVLAYDDIPEADLKPLDSFLRRFAFAVQGDVLERGWIFEVKDSVKGFLGLDAEAFQEAALAKYGIGKLFGDERYRGSEFKGLARHANEPDTVIKTFKKTEDDARALSDAQNVQRPLERLVGHSFEVFKKLYNFDTV